MRAQMIKNAADYIVINDGQCQYPILRGDLLPGDTEASITAMGAEEYAEWCQAVPADQRVSAIGTVQMVGLCRELLGAGADEWIVF